MSELYCTVCSRFVETDGMTLVQDFRGRAGRGNVATFLDRRSGTAHVVLSEKRSAKYRSEAKPEPQVTVVKREVPPTSAQPAEVPAPTAPEVVEAQAQTEPAQELYVEDWTPYPDEWFSATVTVVKEGYGFADLSNNEQVFFRTEDVTPSESGGHKCFKVGDALAIRVEKNDGGGKKWKAIEVYNQTPHDQDSTTAIVFKWDLSGHWGLVRRECGCSLFVSINQVVYLSPGDRVRVSKIVKNDVVGRDDYVGRHIEIFARCGGRG